MKRKILNQTKFVEKNAKNAPVKDISWEATQAQTDGFRIEDGGYGRPIVLRQFEYQYPPGFIGKPLKEEILTEGYIKYLENGLWADNMEMIMEPKVVFSDTGFKVFATCQAKKGNLVPDYAQGMLKPLQNIIQGK